MATRVVEGKKPYTGGKAISIDENKVISLNLRDENNLIIYDAGDDEIYVDLQLDDEITPTSAFPIGVNVGRVIVDNGWDKPGTIISAETTSGDNIKIFYADEGTLWIDNGTGTFKQIYFKADVDALLLALRNYIDGELAKKQNGVSSDTAPSNPSEGDLWYDTTNSAMKVWDGTAWQSVGTGGGGSDIVYATQAEYNALLPGALTDNKHYFIYTSDSPTPPTPIVFSYDFTTKTTSDLANDGWTVGTGVTTDSGGFRNGDLFYPLSQIGTIDATKKITINAEFITGTVGSWTDAAYQGLSDYNTIGDRNRIGVVYTGFMTNSDYKLRWQIYGSQSSASNDFSWTSNTEYSATLVIDLATKEMSVEVNLKSDGSTVVTATRSLSDTEVTNFVGSSYLITTNGNRGETHNISITIE